jgi:hypothetical protein
VFEKAGQQAKELKRQLSSRPYQEVDYDAVVDQVVESIDGQGSEAKPTPIERKPSMIQPLAPVGAKKNGKSVLQELMRMVRKDPGTRSLNYAEYISSSISCQCFPRGELCG